jgi:hypothetical protein
MRAIRSGAFKLIDKTKPELYDLTRDPGETHDLAAELPTVAARLTRRLQAWNHRLDTGAATRAAPSAPIAENVRERLAALGYLAGSGSFNGIILGRPGSDPRDHVKLFNCLTARATGPPSSRRACYRERNLGPNGGTQ